MFFVEIELPTMSITAKTCNSPRVQEEIEYKDEEAYEDRANGGRF